MDNLILPISAGLSGVIEVLLTHPVDRIKTKIQELALDKKHTIKQATISKSVKIIYNEKGFYLGIIPRIVGVVPMRIVYWSTIITMNKFVENQKSIIKYMLPGLVAGSVQTLVDNPIEVVKIQLMTKGHNKSLDFKFFSINGIKKLYVGFTPTIIRNSIFAVCVASIVNKFGQKKEHKFIAGAIGGFIGSILSQPFDVVKTELQRYDNNSINKGTYQILKNIAKTNPIKLWSGTTMRCTLSFLNMGIGFCALGCIQENVFNIL